MNHILCVNPTVEVKKAEADVPDVFSVADVGSMKVSILAGFPVYVSRMSHEMVNSTCVVNAVKLAVQDRNVVNAAFVRRFHSHGKAYAIKKSVG